MIDDDEDAARHAPIPTWCFPRRAKDMLYGDAIFVRDMLIHDHDNLYDTYGIRPEEAEQSLRYVELAELRAWGVDEMMEAVVANQASSDNALRRRIVMAMKAEATAEFLLPGDAILLMERSGLMLSSELRDAVVNMSTRSYAEDGIDFSLEDENRLRRLLGKPALSDIEAEVLHAEGASAEILGSATPPSATPLGPRVEYVAAWWDATMDASVWWSAESISPINAAMILSRLNPNNESLEAAETNSSDEMGPDDFRRLKNTFEGALDSKKTLQAWTAYARERGLKIHSWIQVWETWVAEVDANNELQVTARSDTVEGASAVETGNEIQVAPQKVGRAVHKLRSRTQPLDAEIQMAKENASQKDDSANVWSELTKLAERATGAMIGYSSDGIQYRGRKHQSDGIPDVFTFKNLRDRMARKRRA